VTIKRTAVLSTIVILACSGEGRGPSQEQSGGTVVISTAADVDVLIPPLTSQTTGRQVAEQIFDRLAEIGDDLNTTGDGGFTPALAESWAWSADSLSIAFRVNPRARWHDGLPVTAFDVQFTHALYADPEVASPAAPLLANIDSVTVSDSSTAVFWYGRRTPGQFFETVYFLLVMPRHHLESVPRTRLRESAFARAPVGSGRFRFVSRVPAASIELAADTANYRGRARLDRLVWVVAADFSTAATRFLAREADVFEALRPEQIAEIERSDDLRAIMVPTLDYAFVQFNMRHAANRDAAHPLFGDQNLRRALTMAVNREGLVRNVFDSLAFVAVGPVSRGLTIADTTVTQIPYDSAAAGRLLDSLGWNRRNRDGVRLRDGRPLQFTLLVPGSSRNRVRMAVLLQEQLRGVGVRMNIEQMEYATFVERSRQRRFDAVFGAWRIDAAPHGIRQTWGSAGSRSPNGLNYGSYENAAFDAYVDSALSTANLTEARAHFRRAQEIIVADAPAIWMYEPRTAIGLHARLRPQHVRVDAWWAGLADWSVDPENRLRRDQPGFAAR
jgi:peptide/nickel transport system substrate-binding protein